MRSGRSMGCADWGTRRGCAVRFRPPPDARPAGRPGNGGAVGRQADGLAEPRFATRRWVDPKILTKLSRSLTDGSIVVTGTNGKTTTAALIRHILEAQGRKSIANQAGANLIFGVTAAVLNRTSWTGTVPATVGLFEIDEASLPRLVEEVAPGTIVVTNLFRDQLDRYGELETTAAHIRRALVQGPEGMTAVLNADDPM